MPFDVLLRAGDIVDGTGAPRTKADVGVSRGKIEAVGDLSAATARTYVDASGRIVAPGFIDIHSHSDFTLLVDPRALSQIYQGVTTEVIGNCGHGCAPVRGAIDEIKANVYGFRPGVAQTWHSTGEYLARLERERPAVNVAALVPHGNLRLAAVGDTSRPATPDEARQMKALLEEGLAEGGWGYSLGLEYPAERESSPKELTTLARMSASHGGLFAVHTRNREKLAAEGVQEAVDIAVAAGARLQVSHIIPRRGGPADSLGQCLGAIDSARARGVDAAFDIHTRLHGITNLINALPPEMLANGIDSAIAGIRTSHGRERVRARDSIISSFGLGGWDRVAVFSIDRQNDLKGRSIAELAGGGDPWDALLEVLINEHDLGGDAAAVVVTARSYEEAQLLEALGSQLCGVGSDATSLCRDGPLAGETFLGAYTWAGWFFRRACRETGALTLEEAVRRVTSLPAAMLGLSDRGTIAKGEAADIFVFDPELFGDRGTLGSPNEYAIGAHAVLVNGTIAFESGRPTGTRAGRVLRRNG